MKQLSDVGKSNIIYGLCKGLGTMRFGWKRFLVSHDNTTGGKCASSFLNE